MPSKGAPTKPSLMKGNSCCSLGETFIFRKTFLTDLNWNRPVRSKLKYANPVLLELLAILIAYSVPV